MSNPRTLAAILVRDALQLLDDVVDFVDDGDAEDGRLFVARGDGPSFYLKIEMLEP
jgi:hypothetical protein